MEERSLLEMTTEILRAQASHAAMSAEEMTDAIRKVYKALRWVQTQEQKAAMAEEAPSLAGVDSIQRSKVICLECGKSFKQLSAKHLKMHNLTPKEYKQKHSIPMRQSLSSRALSAKRRRIAKDKGLGEKLAQAKKKRG
ncbi:MAG: MucR family transcriptional regulator [Thermodesulfobacteriota bacterium]